MKINNRKIGKDNPTYIIAEISANHNGSIDTAYEMIKLAKEAGADAVKIQTYTADTITLNSNNKYFKIQQDTIWGGQTLYDLYKNAYTPWEWQPKLKEYADKICITLFSSPFDKTAVDFLEEMDTPAYKIASFEITDIPLIEYVASKGKPVIISTGIATEEEIHEAIIACQKMGNDQVVILKCTSSYPAPLEEMNLASIPDMKNKFNVPVGLSDHTLSIETPITALALGACVIEKHFIIDRAIGGPDAEFSLNIQEFSDMVSSVRKTEKLIGKVNYELSDKALKNREFSRSLFVAEDIKTGEIFTEKNIRSVRPGFGLAPKYLNHILGKKAKVNLKKGTPLTWSCME